MPRYFPRYFPDISLTDPRYFSHRPRGFNLNKQLFAPIFRTLFLNSLITTIGQYHTAALSMGYHPRIECKEIPSLQTTRARNSELWFVNNPKLEHAILGYAARYSKRYEVKLYAFAIEGNHVQKAAGYPNGNRACFMRDFNSSVARAIPRYQSDYPGGRFWARRYSSEYLPGAEDLEDYFFYIVLQPVNDGLVDDIKDYPGYNCFEDAVTGTARDYKVVNWKQYNDARRWNPAVPIDDFTEICTLKYERLPGYEHLSQEAYAAVMRTKLLERTKEVLRARNGTPCLGVAKLKQVQPGSRPKSTKTSGPRDHRPRVLSKNPERRSAAEAWYFSIYFEHKKASKEYLGGNLNVDFPEGTYKPPLFTVARTGTIL
jgi:putative transposase